MDNTDRKILLGLYSINGNGLLKNSWFRTHGLLLSNFTERVIEINQRIRDGGAAAYVTFGDKHVHLNAVSLEKTNDRVSVYGWIDRDVLAALCICDVDGEYSMCRAGESIIDVQRGSIWYYIRSISGWRYDGASKTSKTVLTKSFTSITG